MSGLTLNDYMHFHAKIGGYKISNQQVKSDDADVMYYGYLDRKGAWYIMKRDGSDGGANVITFKFIKGSSLYSTNWTGREGLTYATFDSTFG